MLFLSLITPNMYQLFFPTPNLRKLYWRLHLWSKGGGLSCLWQRVQTNIYLLRYGWELENYVQFSLLSHASNTLNLLWLTWIMLSVWALVETYPLYPGLPFYILDFTEAGEWSFHVTFMAIWRLSKLPESYCENSPLW